MHQSVSGTAPTHSRQKRSTYYFLFAHPFAKAFRHRLRLLRPVRPLSITFIAIVTLITFILLIHIPLRTLLHPRNLQHPTQHTIGHTAIGTPLLSLPTPYGVSTTIMAHVLSHVHDFLLGGAKQFTSTLHSSIDYAHLHGALIGHDPITRLPQWTPTPFDFSQETPAMKRAAHAYTCFNKVRSDSLPLDRPVPDVRPPVCESQWYYNMSTSPAPRITSLLANLATRPFRAMMQATLPKSALSQIKPPTPHSLPTASVLIVFYNEPLSPLLRTVHSILNRTPPHLLHEIILIDDGSDDKAPWLAPDGALERHLQLLPSTRLARLNGRNGLMRARNVAASLAEGDVLMFLDSHVEVTNGWLEPLLGRIAEGWRDGIDRVVVPAIDFIDADSFEFHRGGIDVLGHTWGLGQVGVTNASRALDATESEERDGIAPMRSPIMAGGLFALSREHFDRLGFYDPEMRVWGGEEMEISFRIWLCGGTLECVPCSRVGHVFRSSKFWQGQVYKVPGDVVARNKHRASYWMQEYAQFAKLSLAPLKVGDSIGSMKFYDDTQKRLKCRPFGWYLLNVYPQMVKSAEKLTGRKVSSEKDASDSGELNSAFAASGYMRNTLLKGCVDHLHFKSDGAIFGVYPCHYLQGSQSMVMTRDGLVMSGDRLLQGCLTRSTDLKLRQAKCVDEFSSQQVWTMEPIANDTSGNVLMKGEGRCLTLVRIAEVEDKSPFSLRMMECGGSLASYQAWNWEKNNKMVGSVTRPQR